MRVVFRKWLILNTVDDDDDNDDDLSRLLLGLATSRAALSGSCVLDFRHWRYSHSRQSPKVKRTIWGQKPEKGPKHQIREPADHSKVLANEGGI